MIACRRGLDAGTDLRAAGKSTPALVLSRSRYPRYLVKVRRLPWRKALQNQPLKKSVLNPHSREVWRKTAGERQFQVSTVVPQSGGLLAKARANWRFLLARKAAENVGRGQTGGGRGTGIKHSRNSSVGRSETNCIPTFSGNRRIAREGWHAWVRAGSEVFRLLKLPTARASQRVEEAFRRKRLMPYLGSKRLQGIIDSNPHRSHRADQTAFADALSAESGR
jgi:hypothetical protein